MQPVVCNWHPLHVAGCWLCCLLLLLRLVVQSRTSLKSFLKRFVARQYGLKSLAAQQIAALRASLLRYAVTSARCRVFGWLVGAFVDEAPDGAGLTTGGACERPGGVQLASPDPQHGRRTRYSINHAGCTV
jgi:hypothetical protein